VTTIGYVYPYFIHSKSIMILREHYCFGGTIYRKIIFYCNLYCTFL